MKEVTLKFFSVEEKLPEKSGYYITVCINNNLESMYILHYSIKHKKFNTYDHQKKPTFAIDGIAFWADISDINNIIRGKE